MHDDDFEDLFGGGDMVEGSSQESLTNAAANLAFCESDEEEPHQAGQSSPATSVTSVHSDDDGSTHVKKPACTIDLTAGIHEHRDEELQLDISADSPPRAPETQTSSVIGKIEAVFEQVADGTLSEQNEISLALKVRTKQASTIHRNQQSRATSDPIEAKERRLCFPGKTAEEAWRFSETTGGLYLGSSTTDALAAVSIRILELMHEALRASVTLSKRDIYYRDPALFGKQGHVDRYVDDIAFTFGVPRSALNVSAVAKGLVGGAITFCRRDGSVVNAAADRDGMLVPSLKEVLSVNMTAVKWIVVIEKEASFRSIASSSFWEKLSTQGVLITGKGYPDIATRALLRFLSTPSPQNGFAAPPVYGLADFDPDGLAILATYKHGSVALAHESAELRVPQLKWLGLRSEHILLGGDSTHANQGLLTLTARDRGKARKMLERGVLDEDDGGDAGVGYSRELQVMLMLNVKAELQLLDAVLDGMAKLLESELGGL